MLVLKRDIEQAIVIDVPPREKWTTIRLVVCGVSENKVKLGFEAEQSVTIMREEIVGANGSVRLNH